MAILDPLTAAKEQISISIILESLWNFVKGLSYAIVLDN